MKLQLFTYTCEPLGHVFNAPELPLSSYGEFLLRDATGTSAAYLNGLSDPTYSEVSALLATLPDTQGLPAKRRADVLQRLYGDVACDPDASGRPLRIGQHPRCPTCSSTAMRSWDEAIPIGFVDVDVPPVTHGGWRSLTEDQKADAVTRWLQTSDW